MIRGDGLVFMRLLRLESPWDWERYGWIRMGRWVSGGLVEEKGWLCWRKQDGWCFELGAGGLDSDTRSGN